MAVFEHRLRVRFQHTDPAGIVFFANILVYCHEAYEEFLRASGMPLEDFLGKREHSLPLGHAEATFKKPFRAGQLVTVRLRIGRVGERSFRVEYDLFGQGGEHLATAATDHICVEAGNGKSASIPPQLRALLEKYSTPA